MLICERLLEMGVGMLRFFPSELLWLAVQYRDENCEIFPYLSEWVSSDCKIPVFLHLDFFFLFYMYTLGRLFLVEINKNVGKEIQKILK